LCIHFFEEIVDAAPITTVMALIKEPPVPGIEIPPCLLLVLLAVSTDRTGTVGTVFFLPFEVPEFGR
jgi:hypothetical protein